MECVIPQRGVRMFSWLIQCFQKIGEELWLEPKEEGLILRTLNGPRSAYILTTLYPTFFDGSYRTDPGLRCKIGLKPLLAVFRSVSKVEKCRLVLDSMASRLIVELRCKLGIKKVFRLTYTEVDQLNAVYHKEMAPKKIISSPRVLLDIVQNFHSSVDEISIEANAERLLVESYEPESEEPGEGSTKKLLHTRMTVPADDFEKYIITGENTVISFSLREFKAFLSLCEHAGRNVEMLFSNGGEPIVFALQFFTWFSVDFVMATLYHAPAAPVSSQSCSSQVSASGSYSNAAYSESSSYVSRDVHASQMSARDSAPGRRATMSSHDEDEDDVMIDDEHGVVKNSPISSSYASPAPIGVPPRARSLPRDVEEIEDSDEDDGEVFMEGTPPPSPHHKKKRRITSQGR